MEEESLLEIKFKQILKWTILVSVSILAIFLFTTFGYGVCLLSYEILHNHKDEVVALYLKVIFEHFGATIGLPLAALTSLGLVLLLRFSAGPIEFEGFGFKFKGASGPLIFWILSFLAFTTAIKLLW